MLKPDIALLDEIDSGLDVDALKTIANVIDTLKQQGTTFIIVSHYDRLYELVHVNKTVVVVNGRIALQGDENLAKRISHEGYSFLETEYDIKIEKQEKTANSISIGSCGVKQVMGK